VPDQLVLDWAYGLPGGPEIFIVSLLGRKPWGASEFSLYSSFDDAKSFQEWLNAIVSGRKLHIVNHPTIDLEVINLGVLAAAAVAVRRLVSERNTVVVMDSGGCTRTRAVAGYLGAVPNTVSSYSFDTE